MYKIIILWSGKIWYAITKKLIDTRSDILVYLVCRNPRKVEKDFYDHEQVIVKGYDESLEKWLPCIVSVSCDESKIIKELMESWVEHVDRASVAKYNLEIIESMQNYLKQIEASTYFILTNPVETIMESLIDVLPEEKMFWLWLDLDSRRIQKAIKILLWISIEDMICTGTHSNPVPLLEKKIEMESFSITTDEILLNVSQENTYEFNLANINIYEKMEHILNEYEKTNWKRIEGREILHIIEKLVKILVQSEFDSGKPPVEHPATSVVHVIISFLQKKVVNICYITGGTVMWWMIKIRTE